MKKEPSPITFAEVMKELDTYRPRGYPWTKEMDELLLKARAGKLPVSWEKLFQIWKKLAWPEISEEGLKSRYRRIRLANKD